MRFRYSLLLVGLAFFLGNGALWADSLRTTITLKELDCPSCAKKLATRLSQLPGVAEVKTNLDAKTATIVPRPNEQPSPRALWDTVEKAGFEPVKLEGPAGNFKEKPKS